MEIARQVSIYSLGYLCFLYYCFYISLLSYFSFFHLHFLIFWKAQAPIQINYQPRYQQVPSLLQMFASDLEQQIASLLACEPLPQKQLYELCQSAKEVLSAEPNVVSVKAPVIVCGDIHGQFYDLMQLFAIGGRVPTSNYLFLGDYVNRGLHSVQTFSLLLALKVRYRDRITLLRGNHEGLAISQTYGFYDECSKKYGNANVWKCFTEVFNCLPLAAVIGGQIFCVHAGLSFSIDKLDQIGSINRFRDVPCEGPMCNLLWTDPDQRQGWNLTPQSFFYYFGPDVSEKFLHDNSLKFIARAHQLTMEGYSIIHNEKLVTIFSAPNYCYRCGNLAAMMEVNEHLERSYTTFEPALKSREGLKEHRAPDYFV